MPGPLDQLRLPQAGDLQISEEVFRVIVEQVKRAINLEGGGAVTGPYGASIVQRPGAPAPIYARMTAVSSTAGFYEWEQVRPNLANGNWETLSNGLTHNNFGEVLVPQFVSAAAIGSIYELKSVIAQDGTTQRIAVVQPGAFRAKITASSSGSDDHTFVEIDADDAELTGGRTATDAKAMNARKGVPVDTEVMVFDLGPTAVDGDPVHRFIITDGLTTSPKNLIGSGATADATAWDIETDSQPVLYLPARTFDDTASSGNFYAFRRQVLTDASGMVVAVSGETRSTLPGNGYYETRANNVLVDQIASNGILDFDDQQTPGTDEVVVQWSLTGGQDGDAVEAGNDGLRTQIQGIVDVSGLTGSTALDGVTIFNHLIRVTDAAAGGTYTIDSDDYGGRNITATIYMAQSIDAATWQDATTAISGQDYFIAEAETTDQSLGSLGGMDVFIDASDSRKLKFDLPGGSVPSTGFFNYVSIMVIKGPRKVIATDIDLDITA